MDKATSLRSDELGDDAESMALTLQTISHCVGPQQDSSSSASQEKKRKIHPVLLRQLSGSLPEMGKVSLFLIPERLS